MFVDRSIATRRIRDNDSAHKARDYTLLEDFVLETISRSSAVSGTASTITLSDATLYHLTASNVTTWKDIVANVPLHHTDGINYLSLTPSVATIDAVGVVTPLMAGTTNINAFVPQLGGRQYVLTVDINGSGTQNILLSFLSGSLGKHVTDKMVTLLTGISPPVIPIDYTQLPIAYNPLLKLYTPNGSQRNSNLWCGYPKGLSAMGDASGPYAWGVTLVTRRDAIVASHVFAGDLAIGQTSIYGNGIVNFFDSNGTATQMLVASRTKCSNDITVLTFTSDVPTSIDVMSVCPSNLSSYLPQPQYGYPCLFRTQDDTINVGDIISTDNGMIVIYISTNTLRKPWWQTPRGGDSSSTVALLADVGHGNELHFLTDFWSGYHTGSGSFDGANITAINAAMAANGSPYQIRATKILSGDGQLSDFSSFNTY
jgi:hypothetical protein